MSWTLFHARFHQTLKDKQLLPPHSKVLMAVSGGQDSLCLAQLMLDLQPKGLWNLAIAHCDHRWPSNQGSSDPVAKIAKNWHLPFHLQKAHTTIPETEAAARKWRYQALTEIAETHGFPYLITGHTMSDRAETLLYNLVRGAGSDGLTALTWQRNLTDKIKLIRPLLNFSRQETRDFCQQFNLPIWEDIYNTKKKYARNRIRLDLIPYLKQEFNPQVETKLAQTAELLRADVEYLEHITQQIFKEIITEDKKALNRLKLGEYPLALQRRVVRQFLAENLPKKPNFEQIEAVTKLIYAPNKSRTFPLAKSLILEVRGPLIILLKLSKLPLNK
jgi:tRNA(Ile)-lysidine synthase